MNDEDIAALDEEQDYRQAQEQDEQMQLTSLEAELKSWTAIEGLKKRLGRAEVNADALYDKLVETDNTLSAMREYVDSVVEAQKAVVESSEKQVAEFSKLQQHLQTLERTKKMQPEIKDFMAGESQVTKSNNTKLIAIGLGAFTLGLAGGAYVMNSRNQKTIGELRSTVTNLQAQLPPPR